MEDINKGRGQLAIKNLSTGEWPKVDANFTNINMDLAEGTDCTSIHVLDTDNMKFCQEFTIEPADTDKFIRIFVDDFVKKAEARLALNDIVTKIRIRRRLLQADNRKSIAISLYPSAYKILNKASHLICNCNLKRYLEKVPVGKVRIVVIRDTRIESCQRVMAASLRNACGRRSS